MTESYPDVIDTVASLIAEAMLEREPEWEGSISPDRRLFRFLMAVGLAAMPLIMASLGVRYEAAASARGYVGERRPTVNWMTLFGGIGVVSVYMRKAGESAGSRPMRDNLGVEGGGKSCAVRRALTDFGIDESFGAAAAKFKEHYDTTVHRTTVRRTVLKLACRAEAFIEKKLATRAPNEDKPHLVMVQADGANAPLVVLERIEGEVTRTGRPKMKKTCTFREVRLGLAVPDGCDEPTYVAQVGDFGRFATTLALVARHRGADDAECTYAVTDGGIGIRERIEAALEIDQYILDKRHCRSHLLDTATEMESTDPSQQTTDWMGALKQGNADAVIAQLDQYRDNPQAPGAERARQLGNHLTRFKDAVHYDDFVNRGLIIGSGEVESAHRHVTQRRLKIAGAWWTEENMDLIAALRSVRANGWWDEFCQEAA